MANNVRRGDQRLRKIISSAPPGRLLGMCRRMGSHFHDWIDYDGVAFSIVFLEWVAHFVIFVIRKFFIFTVSK